MRRVALVSAALAFCLPAQWVAGASAAVACLTAATGRRLGASARLGVAIVASATRLDSTLSQELPHALVRVMAHAARLNARLASRKCATVLAADSPPPAKEARHCAIGSHTPSTTMSTTPPMDSDLTTHIKGPKRLID